MHKYTLTSWAARAAARGALAAMVLGVTATIVSAQDPEKADKAIADAKAAKQSTAEIGLGGVSHSSFKAGEYNGLQSSGAFADVKFELRSHVPYDGASAVRWRIVGTDMGLETRRLTGEVGVQGRYRLGFAYDEILRNQSDSYQTPYNGTGTNGLTLPGAWQLPTIASPAGNTLSARGLVPSIGTAPYLSTATNNFGATITPTSAQIAQVMAAANADVPLFHNYNLATKRTRFDVGFAARFNDKLGMDVSVRPEHKDGVKPMGTVSRNTGGDLSMIMPDRIDTNHNQVSANLNFAGKKAYGQVGYYGSYFMNNVGFMSWQNWGTGPTGTGTTNTMSSTPNNAFVQVNGSAGVKLNPTTKLVLAGSYGRATQNETFLTDAYTPVVPATSLNGLVVNSLFNARLTAKPMKKVNLTASFKYTDRDNQTPVNLFHYADAGQTVAASTLFPASSPLGQLMAQNANANRPYSRRANQAAIDADYNLGPGQWLKAGYDFEHIARECPGTWIACADAATTNENTLRAEWRTTGYLVTARLGYAHSARRTSDYNENAFLALVPYANVSPTTATGGASAYSFMVANGWTGYGPVAPFAATTGNMNVFFASNNALSNTTYGNLNRISELIGMRRYYVADRNRDKVRTSLTWQASDAFGLQAGFDLNRDDYPSSVYGLQNSKGYAFNLDGSYAVASDISADVFYTYENQRLISAGNSYTANSSASTVTGSQPGVVGLSGNAACNSYTTLLQRNTNAKQDPCLNWSTNMPTISNSGGFGLTKKTARADLMGNLTFSRVSWDNAVTGGSWANNPVNGAGAPPTTVAAYFIPATATPTVTTNTLELRLSGKMALAPHQGLRVSYAYLRMTSADYRYEGMQIGVGTISGVLPTNEQPFAYSINMFSAAYVVTF